jgi:hypothetical protein
VAKGKRIFDPIHRFIELDAGEVALLEAPAVQRLRRLRQLGLAYLAFPSAEHSRFTHALGALAIGTRALEAIRGYSPGAFASERDCCSTTSATVRSAMPANPYSASATKRAPNVSSPARKSRTPWRRSTSMQTRCWR